MADRLRSAGRHPGLVGRRPGRPAFRRCQTPAAPFWAMDSLPKEHRSPAPRTGLMPGRSPARARTPDRHRADRRPARPRGLDGRRIRRWRLSSSAIALSKKFCLPDQADETPGPMVTRLVCPLVVAATLRVQLLGRQFVLARPLARHGRGRRARQRQANLGSATTCWAKAHAPVPTRCATWPATRTLSQIHSGSRRFHAGNRSRK